MIKYHRVELSEEEKNKARFVSFDKNGKRMPGYDMFNYKVCREIVMKKLNEWYDGFLDKPKILSITGNDIQADIYYEE